MDPITAGYRDPELAKKLVVAIQEVATRPMKIMEVCGTHTMAIAKNGLRDIMPEPITLLSGPGCPVCVTANRDIDTAIEMGRRPDVILTTFGDMMKVPGSYSSLTREKGDGRDIRVVYSPLDALQTARDNPDKTIVFIAVGFETTAPLVASAVVTASDEDLSNFTVLSMHKTVPEALRALVNDPGVQIDGFILPGHVSAIIGLEPYRFLATEFGVPSVITGFEPIDVLQGVLMLAKQIAEGRPSVEIAYARAVPEKGNPAAILRMQQIFEPTDADWRGLGVIPGTGLAVRPEFARFDALVRVPVTPPEPREPKGCQCGDVLRGAVLPYECRLFGSACTPEHAVGPCMVSSEGSCAAYYRYTDYGKRA